MKKAFAVNGAILLLLIAGTWIFDRNLQLGDLHGLVFKLYLAYGSAALFAVNAVIAGVLMVKKRKHQAKSVIISGFIVAIMGGLIAYASPA